MHAIQNYICILEILTLSAGNGIGLDISSASPVFSSICAYNFGHCKQEKQNFIYGIFYVMHWYLN